MQAVLYLVHKLEANGVAAREVCSFDYMVLSEGSAALFWTFRIGCITGVPTRRELQ